VATSSNQVGLQLNIPIYSGGLTSSQVRQSYAQLDQSEQQREALRRQVVENTRNLHRAVNTDVEQVQARKQSIISNQSAVEATEIGYQVGTRNIVDVLDAQRQLYTSVRNYNNSRYDYILDNLRLKQAAGTLNPGTCRTWRGTSRPTTTRTRTSCRRTWPRRPLPAMQAGQAVSERATLMAQGVSAHQPPQPIQQPLQRALIGRITFKPASAIRCASWAVRTAPHRQCQAFGIIHFLQRPGVAQLRGDFEEVEQVRPAQHRLGQRRRFQQVVPAIGHQAAADEGTVGQGIEKQQLAHGVAQQHLCLRVTGSPWNGGPWQSLRFGTTRTPH
jgi:hypothetical protein